MWNAHRVSDEQMGLVQQLLLLKAPKDSFISDLVIFLVILSLINMLLLVLTDRLQKRTIFTDAALFF